MKTISNFPGAVASGAELPAVEFGSRRERLEAGKTLRDRLPRQTHAAWAPARTQRDAIDILEESNQERLSQLVPIRYGRMLRTPFTFLRGAAGLMAFDLSTTPNTGIVVQACGITPVRAHAKSGDATLISGYLGKSDAFDQASGEFALAYADQNERDHAALVAAVRSGRISARVEENL